MSQENIKIKNEVRDFFIGFLITFSINISCIFFLRSITVIEFLVKNNLFYIFPLFTFLFPMSLLIVTVILVKKRLFLGLGMTVGLSLGPIAPFGFWASIRNERWYKNKVKSDSVQITPRGNDSRLIDIKHSIDSFYKKFLITKKILSWLIFVEILLGYFILGGAVFSGGVGLHYFPAYSIFTSIILFVVFLPIVSCVGIIWRVKILETLPENYFKIYSYSRNSMIVLLLIIVVTLIIVALNLLKAFY